MLHSDEGRKEANQKVRKSEAARSCEYPAEFASTGTRSGAVEFPEGISWSPNVDGKGLGNTLRIGLPEAKEATAVLQLQGYIQPAGHAGKWRTTEQGEIVSAAKPPRFTRQSVEDALAGIRARIKSANADPQAQYRIAEAVAFGDFLRDTVRVQAADVGIRLEPRSEAVIRSATEHAAELDFLKQLRGKTALLHVVPYEDWMSSRSHQRLL